MMTETTEMAAFVEQLRAEMAELKARLAALEQEKTPSAAEESAPAPVVEEGITEDEVLAISAALAAWFGVRVRIRQIRLISSAGWAQEGRVSIQASHRLHG
jgi:methylmalonyl-CoA carboxyltransferase large subunit